MCKCLQTTPAQVHEPPIHHQSLFTSEFLNELVQIILPLGGAMWDWSQGEATVPWLSHWPCGSRPERPLSADCSRSFFVLGCLTSYRNTLHLVQNCKGPFRQGTLLCTISCNSDATIMKVSLVNVISEIQWFLMCCQVFFFIILKIGLQVIMSLLS